MSPNDLALLLTLLVEEQAFELTDIKQMLKTLHEHTTFKGDLT